MDELYCEEITKYLNKDTKILLNLEFYTYEEIDEEIDKNNIKITELKYPKLQSYKGSNIYENIIQHLSDKYYNDITEKGNIKYFIPYDEPKYMFDLDKNCIEITYIHDMRKYNILTKMKMNIVEYILYDNYYMVCPFDNK